MIDEMMKKTVIIRLARPEDAPDMAETHIRSWEVAYRGIVPAEYISQKNASRHDLYARVITEKNDTNYIIQYAGKTVGLMKIAPPQDDDLGDEFYEVQSLYLHPDYFRMGIGSKALEFAFEKARNLSKTAMAVWVLADNINSIRFYEKHGFIADGKIKDAPYGKVNEIIRMRKNI